MHNSDAAVRDEGGPIAAAVLARLRERAPRVHCVTNAVAQNFTANVLLAAGAVPSMTLSAEEIVAFVSRSDALLINLGTFDRTRREATVLAIEAASTHNVPWLLDPVFVDRSTSRATYARDLVTLGPRAVRLNRDEFAALAARDPAPAAVGAYALDRTTVVGLSGKTDLVTDGRRAATVENGHVLMAKVTAMGCAASALMAACHAVEADPWRASVAGLTIVGVAGERAAKKAHGPGSFAAAILDEFHNLDEAALLAHARVTLSRTDLAKAPS